jgi:hypothetical protein
MLDIVRSCIGTKFVSRFGDMVCELALDAVGCVATTLDGGRQEIDIKRYARVEKIPGGFLTDSKVRIRDVFGFVVLLCVVVVVRFLTDSKVLKACAHVLYVTIKVFPSSVPFRPPVFRSFLLLFYRCWTVSWCEQGCGEYHKTNTQALSLTTCFVPFRSLSSLVLYR